MNAPGRNGLGNSARLSSLSAGRATETEYGDGSKIDSNTDSARILIDAHRCGTLEELAKD